MTYGQSGNDVQIDTQGAIPIVTMMVIFGFVVAYAFMSTNKIELWEPHALAQRWMDNNSFTAITMQQWIVNQQWEKIFGQLPMASMAAFAGFQVIGNSYFLWFFGSKVEQKMGAGRYFLLCLAAMYIPYVVLWYEGYRLADANHYYGPCFLILTVLGAYFLFPEPKEINTKWFKQSRGEIFVRDQQKDLTKKYEKRNVKLYILLFALYEVGLYFYSIKITAGYLTFHWLPALAGLIMGYLVAGFLVWSATGSLQDGAIKLMCIRKYNQILKLDVGHDVAIRGTSMALGLPEERVKEWVSQQKGKMSVK